MAQTLRQASRQMQGRVQVLVLDLAMVLDLVMVPVQVLDLMFGLA